jgi:hypothetical protein
MADLSAIIKGELAALRRRNHGSIVGGQIRVPSSKGDKEYSVDIAMDGQLYCGCPGFTFRGYCYHLAEITEVLKMTQQTQALVPFAVGPKPIELIPSEETISSIERVARLAVTGAIAIPDALKGKPEAVASIMLRGWEYGLQPMTSLDQLYIVGGRVLPSAQVMAGMLVRDYPSRRIEAVTLTDKECHLRLLDNERPIGEYTVTWADIEKAGLAKDNNLKYPKDRLVYHCTKRLLRMFASDVVHAIRKAPPIDREAARLAPPDPDWDEVDAEPETPEVVTPRSGAPSPDSSSPSGEELGIPTQAPPTALVAQAREAVKGLKSWEPGQGKAYYVSLCEALPHAFTRASGSNKAASHPENLTADECSAVIHSLAAGTALLFEPDFEHDLDQYDSEGHGVCGTCGATFEVAPEAAQTLL